MTRTLRIIEAILLAIALTALLVVLHAARTVGWVWTGLAGACA